MSLSDNVMASLYCGQLRQATLWCEVYHKYERRIDSKKNFLMAWIDRSTNHKPSNVVDHTSSEQHKATMVLFC